MQQNSEFTCRDLVEFLGEYIDGALPIERRRVFDAHLQECADCAAYVDSYRKTVEISKHTFARSTDVPEDPPQELIAAILHARKASGA